ncbi:uncharacterized protein LOC110090738 [Pogona vitticeps]
MKTTDNLGKKKFMQDVLEDLDTSDLQSLQSILNTKEINGTTIPKSKLEKIDPISIANVLISYHGSDCLETLRDALADIPKKQLVEKISNKIEDDEHKEKQKTESRKEEIDGIPAKKQKLQDLPSYSGKFKLSDMEDFAFKNQDQLIKQLEKQLEPAGFETLEKHLSGSTLKNSFSLTSQQYYNLYYCRDLNTFLNNSDKKLPMVPKKILALLFSASKTNKKRGAHKTKRNVQNFTEDDSAESAAADEQEGIKDTRGWKNYKEDAVTESAAADEQEVSNDMNEYKNHNDSIQKTGLSVSESRMEYEMKKSLVNEEKRNVQALPKDKFIEPLDYSEQEKIKDIKYKKSVIKNYAKEETDEVPNTIPENELYEKYKEIFRTLKKKYQEEGRDLLPNSQLYVNKISVRKHKIYSCLRAQDVLLVKLPEETEYRILKILENKKDVTVKGNLKKNVEFELKFNMAILGVQRSVLIHGSNFFTRDASSFTEYEEFFEKIVSKVVLPVLALYKRVYQVIFQKAWAAEDIFLPGVEQQTATRATQS